MPIIGENLPNFTLPCVSAHGETEAALADFAGKTLILFFYPRDDTPGCTRESIEFTENLETFTAANSVILGVSKDSVESHAKFIAKFDLKVGLLSDAGSDFCEQLSVWKEKTNFGKKYMGIERTTVIVDGSGVIRHLWRDVKVDGHVDAVLAAVQAL
ncbi:MAG: peroxiredoxin [Rhodobacteraceae bacterium]|nr:peroxiredoxin [Paracoccaceae bacterium]